VYTAGKSYKYRTRLTPRPADRPEYFAGAALADHQYPITRMTEGNSNHAAIDLRWVAAATAVVLAIIAVAVLLYYLIDILLLLFLGVVVAATLQPWHVKLCTWGMPRGLAVVLIYFLFIIGLIAVTMAVSPVVIEELTKFTVNLPQTYNELRDHLRGNEVALLRVLGNRLPGYDALITSLVSIAPNYFQNVMLVTAGVLTTLAYAVTVFAVGIYWTLELPRVERMVVSLLPVHRRARTLTIWHEIEFKLGGFIRGQFYAMLAVGALSAIGYALIGLPNVFVLGILAALFEAVPMIGPVLAAIPALAVALPMGLPTVLAVIALATFVQVIENNLIVPRIMSGTVGTSALLGLVAVLAFGALYGILGVFIAIPMTAVIQVIVDRLLINAEPREVTATAASQLEELLARVRHIRQQLRTRLRARDSRMGIDPDTADHVVDAADQQIEEAVDHVDQLILTAEQQIDHTTAESQQAIVDTLQDATQHLEDAVAEMTKVDESEGGKRPDAEPPDAALRDAAQRAEGAVERVKAALAITQDVESEGMASEGSANGGEHAAKQRRVRGKARPKDGAEASK
jgi:predicted PurR-regulated permease PerM